MVVIVRFFVPIPSVKQEQFLPTTAPSAIRRTYDTVVVQCAWLYPVDCEAAARIAANSGHVVRGHSQFGDVDFMRAPPCQTGLDQSIGDPLSAPSGLDVDAPDDCAVTRLRRFAAVDAARADQTTLVDGEVDCAAFIQFA